MATAVHELGGGGAGLGEHGESGMAEVVESQQGPAAGHAGRAPVPIERGL